MLNRIITRRQGMKIYHKVEYWKGHIPWDKLHLNHTSFEDYSLNNFGFNNKEENKKFRATPQAEKKDFITMLKLRIKATQRYKDIVKENCHTAYYLNFNVDGIQGFISR